MDEHLARACASQRRILDNNERDLNYFRIGAVRLGEKRGDNPVWTDITQARILELERQNRDIREFLDRCCRRPDNLE